MNGDSDY